MNRRAEVLRPPASRPLLARRRGTGGLDRLLRLFALAALLLTAAAQFGTELWLFELLTHFRVQFVIGAALILMLSLFLRRPVSAMAALAVAAVNAWPLLPYLLPGVIDARAGELPTRILFANVQFSNNDYQALQTLIAAEDPDIVGLAEVDDTWLDALSSLHAEYPHRILRPHPGAQGLALFSRLPFRELDPYVEEGLPTALVVDVEMPATRATLLLAHPLSPVTPGRAALRNVQLDRISKMIQTDRNREQILIGDLNTTPWSPHYQTLEKEAMLSNAAAGRGYWPTWPTWAGGLRLLQIPIDQCLLSEGLKVESYRTGASIGSDHLPIIVDITLPAQRVPGNVEPDAG